jgi:UDP-N-acetylglucosamine 2-epimerase
VHNPYGDGQASRRIADAIAGFRRGEAPQSEPRP